MTRWMALLALVCTAFASPAALAADDAQPVWHVDVLPYVWAAGLYGDVTVKGVTTSTSASFIDILKNSDSIIGIQGRVEVSRGRLGAFVDGGYMKMKEDELGPTQIDLTVRQAFVDFGAFYRVLDTREGAGPGVALDVYGGGRFWYLDVELDPRGPTSFRKSRGWIDPILGPRLIANVNERVFFVVSGDIGGFGVSSDLTWSALGLVGYRFSMFSREAAVVGGYRAVGDDYSTGSGPQRFRWDVTMHGPILGLNVRF